MINTITYGLSTYQRALEPATPPVADENSKASDDKASDRTVRDTVTLSKDGEKIVNLARGRELAAELPDATKDRAAFDAALKRAQEDIKRITSLYGGVLLPTGSAVADKLQAAVEERQAEEKAAYDDEFSETLARAIADIRAITEDFNSTISARTTAAG